MQTPTHDMEQAARQRVAETPDLRKHQETILYPWSNWEEHVKWLATAPVNEIVTWAREVENEK